MVECGMVYVFWRGSEHKNRITANHLFKEKQIYIFIVVKKKEERNNYIINQMKVCFIVNNK